MINPIIPLVIDHHDTFHNQCPGGCKMMELSQQFSNMDITHYSLWDLPLLTDSEHSQEVSARDREVLPWTWEKSIRQESSIQDMLVSAMRDSILPVRDEQSESLQVVWIEKAGRKDQHSPSFASSAVIH